MQKNSSENTFSAAIQDRARNQQHCEILKIKKNTMTNFNLSNFSDALQDVSDDSRGISFAGLAKKWETENDGK